DVIVAWATPALMAAGRATSTMPIVGVSISDVVSTGFVASLARPGGNVTAVTAINPDLSGKLAELLREIVPAMKQVGLLVNPANPGSAVQIRGRGARNGPATKDRRGPHPRRIRAGFRATERAWGAGCGAARRSLLHRASGTDCRACAERAPADRLSAPGKRRVGRPLGIRCG